MVCLSNGIYDKRYIKINLYYKNKKDMFADIRKFVELTETSNLDCIQNYVPLLFPSQLGEPVNYYKDAKVCLSNIPYDDIGNY
jgi:hypothetical protein